MNTTTTRTTQGLAAAAFAATAFAAAAAHADDNPRQPELEAAVQKTIFSGDPVSNAYDAVDKWKEDTGIPIGVGAWHWWHMNRQSPHDFHYGLPTLGGTYYYYVTADPRTCASEGGTQFGAHIDARFRDGEESFRPFFESRAWLWEAYGWLETQGTTIKAGKIWRRFGLDWDGSWYGNVAYFDGWKLDPDWGASAERTLDFGRGVKAPSFLQVFVAEDKVNGSISGADAESAEGSLEKLGFVARTVPTWTLGDSSSLAAGFSYQAQQIDNRDAPDHTVTAGAVDLTWTKGPFKAFGEMMKSVGSRNPANYVTGGPSDRSTDWMLGAQYQWRFVTFRGNVSHGSYEGPSGDQVFYLAGVTLAVTKNVDFYIEYVRWDTQAANGPRVPFEDGFQFVLNWRF
jgi:hypothetical protein